MRLSLSFLVYCYSAQFDIQVDLKLLVRYFCTMGVDVNGVVVTVDGTFGFWEGAQIVFIYIVERRTYVAALGNASSYSVDFGEDVVNFNLKCSADR